MLFAVMCKTCVLFCRKLLLSIWRAIIPQAVRFTLAAGLGHFFGIDKVTGPPVTLDETPSSGDVDGIPGIAEAVVLKAHAGLVSGRFRVAFYNDAVQTGIT